MAQTKTDKFFTKGNAELFLRTLNGDAYADSVTQISGLIEVNVTYSQEIYDIAADDDPAFFSEKGPVTGSGELKLTGIKVSDLEKFFEVETDRNGGVAIGAETATVFRGMAFKSKGSDGSEDYYAMHKVIFDLPAIKTKTVTSEGKEVNECTIPLSVKPYFYTSASGERKRVTATYFNSEVHAAVWDKIKDTVYDPSEDLSPVIPE